MSLHCLDWKLPVLVRHAEDIAVWLLQNGTETNLLPCLRKGAVSLLFEAEIETNKPRFNGCIRVMFMTQDGKVVGRHINVVCLVDGPQWFVPVESEHAEGC